MAENYNSSNSLIRNVRSLNITEYFLSLTTSETNIMKRSLDFASSLIVKVKTARKSQLEAGQNIFFQKLSTSYISIRLTNNSTNQSNKQTKIYYSNVLFFPKAYSDKIVLKKLVFFLLKYIHFTKNTCRRCKLLISRSRDYKMDVSLGPLEVLFLSHVLFQGSLYFIVKRCKLGQYLDSFWFQRESIEQKASCRVFIKSTKPLFPQDRN